MSEVFIGVCLESGCDWHHCDFSETDEKIVLSGAEKHHVETGHTVSVNIKEGIDFKNIKTFIRE